MCNYEQFGKLQSVFPFKVYAYKIPFVGNCQLPPLKWGVLFLLVIN